MEKPSLRLIEGGIRDKQDAEKAFLSATITDTRLMGASAMYIHWRLLGCQDAGSLHQFFYFDDEEYGFETYRSIWGDNEDDLLEMEQALMGGLGGKKKDLTQRQARYLVNKYAAWNRQHNIPLPGARGEYQFLLEHPPLLTPGERESLTGKICTPLKSDWHVINYFLMRCFGKDLEGARYLAAPGLQPERLFSGFPLSTLCRNVIDPAVPAEEGAYACESLVESGQSYFIVVSRLQVRDLRVSSARMVSTMKVSPAEAAMMLSRPEFVSVYDILVDPEEFDEKSWELTISTMVTLHENGRLFLSFNNNNNHVNQKVFRISDDVFGLYFVTDYGQLILSATTLRNIRAMEDRMMKSPLGHLLRPGSKYEFKEPVLYEFIQSDFDDFDEYVDYLNPEDGDFPG